MTENTQLLLDRIYDELKARFGEENVEAYLNDKAKNVPTFIIPCDRYFEIMKVLKEEFKFNYLLGLHGTDFLDYFEINVQLRAMSSGDFIMLKTKIDRDEAKIDSIAMIWPGASFQESEVYDLLGIKFNGNEELYRIFLGDDWVGYPLRKDYKPYENQEVQG